MKNIIKMSIVAAVLISAVACNKWTDPKNLDYRRPTIEQQDPAAYESYLSSLREFKTTDHKLVLLTMHGTSEQPLRMNQHITNMPDSADYIILKYAEGLHPTLKAEVAEVRAKKGTKTLAMADYATYEAEWKDMEDAKDETQKPGTPEEFAAYVTARAKAEFGVADECGCDGIMISYVGNTSSDNGKAGQAAFIKVASDWKAAHPQGETLIRGYVQNLVGDAAKIIEQCPVVVLLCGTADSEGTINTNIKRIVNNVPYVVNHIVLEATLPSADAPDQVGATVQVAAQWVMTANPTYGKKLGLSVTNAQDDYFTALGAYSYKNIREAITILNK